MTTLERQRRHTRSKTPSFSSTLLDAIYDSIDGSQSAKEEVGDFGLRRRNNAVQVEEEIESLRRAIRTEKWMENYSSKSSLRHLPSKSCSSMESAIYSSSETDSSAASKSTSKSSVFTVQKRRKQAQSPAVEKHRKILEVKTKPKKEKEPLSPGGKIANFLNSIFSIRKLKKNQIMEDWSSMRKSRSMKETTTLPFTSRSCLSKSTSSSKVNKSKRAVRFCPVSVVLDEDYSSKKQVPNSNRQFSKKNSNIFLNYKGRSVIMNHETEEVYESDCDLDNRSCTSSDLFELDNIGWVGIGDYQVELPVYGTTNPRMNQAIASGLVL